MIVNGRIQGMDENSMSLLDKITGIHFTSRKGITFIDEKKLNPIKKFIFRFLKERKYSDGLTEATYKVFLFRRYYLHLSFNLGNSVTHTGTIKNIRISNKFNDKSIMGETKVKRR